MKTIVGKVKWMDAKRGYGMIEAEGVEGDVFFHYTELQIKGYKYLAPESRVEFSLQTDVKTGNGLKAMNIKHLT